MQRLLLLAEQDPHRVVITDRSPFSAVFYTQQGHGALLVPLIEACLKDMRAHGVELYTVHVKVDAEVLWRRIQTRLVAEPERALCVRDWYGFGLTPALPRARAIKRYKENSRAWMNEVKGFYDSFPLWSFTVENNEEQRLPDVVNHLVGALTMRSPKFSETNKCVRLPSHRCHLTQSDCRRYQSGCSSPMISLDGNEWPVA